MRDTLSPLRVLIILLGLLLPTVALIPLGSLWLWQHGLLVHWALATLACTLLAYLFERFTLRAPAIPLNEILEFEQGPPLSGAERLKRDAQTAVDAMAKRAGPEVLGSWNDVLNKGLETVETVAKIYHPDRKDPMLRFTVPEALTLIEQVSGRLRPIFEETIPLGRRLTVAQFAQIYSWRRVYDFAGRAWSIWRVMRTLNPATAATYEVRERLSKSIVQWVKETISGRLARAYVHEVGAAAVDLYSGELRRRNAELPARAKSP
jgi:hypothetical protein